jgi:hypothetical protein
MWGENYFFFKFFQKVVDHNKKLHIEPLNQTTVGRPAEHTYPALPTDSSRGKWNNDSIRSERNKPYNDRAPSKFLPKRVPITPGMRTFELNRFDS